MPPSIFRTEEVLVARFKVVYARDQRWVSTEDGRSLFVLFGSHWSADDPVVKVHPDLFSDDPKYGLSFSTNEAPNLASANGDRHVAQRT